MLRGCRHIPIPNAERVIGLAGRAFWFGHMGKGAFRKLGLPVIAPNLVVVKQWPRIELSAEARDLYVIAWPAWALLMLLMGYVSFQWFRAQRAAQTALSQQLEAEKAAAEAAAHQAILLERSNGIWMNLLCSCTICARHCAQSRSMLKFLTKKPSPWAMSNELPRTYPSFVTEPGPHAKRALQYSRIGRSDSQPLE